MPPLLQSRSKLSRWRRGWRGPVLILLAMVLGGICLQCYCTNSNKYHDCAPASSYDMETKSGEANPGVNPKSRETMGPYRLPIETSMEANAGPQPWWREVLCKTAGHWKEQGTPLRRLFRDVTPEKDNNIFLMDTTCNSNPKYRVWCSVESWAKQNPTREVWFLFVSGELAEAALPRILLQSYTNLHVVGADLNDLFKDTPLLELFNSRKWAQEDTWPVELLSDMLRGLVLWWWGGVYSDTDAINIRPFTLPLNAVGFQDPSTVASCFYSFHARHPILLKLMKDMAKNFNSKLWGTIGPRAISRVLRKTCGKNLTALAEKAPVGCSGNLTLYPPHTFNPIPYWAHKTFFKRGGGKDFNKMFNETVTLHFWNKMSKGAVVKVNSSSIYEVAAKKFCPYTFQMATADSDEF